MILLAVTGWFLLALMALLFFASANGKRFWLFFLLTAFTHTKGQQLMIQFNPTNNNSVYPSTLTISNLIITNATSSSVLVTDGSKRLTNSVVTSTELSYVQGSRSNLQNQLDNLSTNGILISAFPETRVTDPYDFTIWSRYTNSSYVTTKIGAGTLAASVNNLTRLDGPIIPVDVILDCDPGADPDDLSDIAIALELQRRGEIKLLGMVTSFPGNYPAADIQIVNRYYGNPNILIGAANDGITPGDGYGTYLQATIYNSIANRTNVLAATTLYRKLLASRPANSVTIVYTGQLRNLYNLWNSAADTNSILTGSQLITNKVKRLVIVAGQYPTSAGEYNFTSDKTAAVILNSLTNSLPLISYSGIEVGDPIIIPTNGVVQFAPNNPVRIAHELQSYTNRPSWGGMGLLYAARGTNYQSTNMFSVQKGYNTITLASGANAWTTNSGANQEYIIKSRANSVYIAILDQLLTVAGGHKIDYKGETISFSSQSTAYPLPISFDGSPRSGLRTDGNLNEFDFVADGATVMRFFKGGLVATNGASLPGVYPGLFWTPSFGVVPNSGIMPDPTAGVRIASTWSGDFGRLTAKETLLGDGSYATPAYTFYSDSTTGFKAAGTGQWDFITQSNTNATIRIFNQGIVVPSTNGYFVADAGLGASGIPTGIMYDSTQAGLKVAAATLSGGALTPLRIGNRLAFNTTTNFIALGTGSPEGALSGNVGSLFLRTDGGSGTSLYIKQADGAAATGWTAVNPSGGGGGGIAGTVINTGTSTNFAIPMYSDTTGTNIIPSGIRVEGTTNLIAGNIEADGDLLAYGVFAVAGLATLNSGAYIDGDIDMVSGNLKVTQSVRASGGIFTNTLTLNGVSVSTFAGTSGTVKNTGASVAGQVPYYSDTTGTNVIPTSKLTNMVFVTPSTTNNNGSGITFSSGTTTFYPDTNMSAITVITKTTIGTTPTNGMVFTNSIAAAAGAQQYSPSIWQYGNGWKTTATAASQPVGWTTYIKPIQGTTSPSGQLIFAYSVNNAAPTELFSMDTATSIFAPITNDGASLGSTSKQFNSVYVSSGGSFVSGGDTYWQRKSSGLWKVSDNGGNPGSAKSAGMIHNIVTKSANYTTTINDTTILCDATSGAITVTLIAPATAYESGWGGNVFTVKKIDSSINNVIISVSGGSNIDGAASVTLTTQYSNRTVQSNGTQYYIVGGFL